MALATISVNFATDAEALAGTSTDTSISPARLKYTLINANYPTAFVLRSGDTMTGSLNVQGSIVASGDITAFGAVSDERLKTNVLTIGNALARVLAIDGVTFVWNDAAAAIQKTGADVGVLAQQVESVFPEVVVTRDNGYKAVHYEKLVPLLIEAIKELNNKVDALSKQLSTGS
jgi:hypothetical protein